MNIFGISFYSKIKPLEVLLERENIKDAPLNKTFLTGNHESFLKN